MIHSQVVKIHYLQLNTKIIHIKLIEELEMYNEIISFSYKYFEKITQRLDIDTLSN